MQEIFYYVYSQSRSYSARTVLVRSPGIYQEDYSTDRGSGC